MQTKSIALSLLLGAGLLGAPRASAEPSSPPPPVHLAITGAIDPALVATSVAAELGRPVEPAGQVCPAPCLNVVVGDGRATVVYTGESGVTRERTVPLGSDAAQWTTVITLLAGNLVRDEAADVLALVPDDSAAPGAAATAPAPAAVVIARPLPPLGDERSSFAAIGLVPFASTDFTDLYVAHALSVDAIAGVHGSVRGFAIAGVVSASHGDVSGLQIAGVSAVGHHVSGVQFGGAATAAGELTGVQFAGAVAVADRSDGVQIAGAVTAAHEAGTQLAGAANFASDGANAQLAGGLNVADGVVGAQLAGGVNVAHGSVGAQLAGGVNVAGRVRGVQIAPLNVASRVDGVQIGVVNIGGGPDDDSFGLINIVPGGRTDLEASVDSTRIGTLLFRHGGKHWHNVYGIGGQYVSEADNMPNSDLWMYGLGIGPSFKVMNLPVDLEAMVWNVNYGSHIETDHVSLLNQLRLSIAVPIGPVKLVVGGAVNVYVATDHSSPLLLERFDGAMNGTPDPSATNTVVKLWPSAFLGVRI